MIKTLTARTGFLLRSSHKRSNGGIEADGHHYATFRQRNSGNQKIIGGYLSMPVIMQKMQEFLT